jgi:hypothetical protein
VQVVYQQYESGLVHQPTQNMGIDPNNFIKDVELKVKMIVLSLTMKRFPDISLTKMHNFIDSELSIGTDLKDLVKRDQRCHILHKIPLNILLKETAQFRKYHEAYSLREVVRSKNFAITYLKNENHVFSLTFLHW